MQASTANMTSEEVWLITGASRGIGAELVKQVWLRAAQHVLHSELAFTQMLLAQVLAKDNTKVIAGARSPKTSPLLHNLQDQFQDRLHILTLDLSSTASILVQHSREFRLLSDTAHTGILQTTCVLCLGCSQNCHKSSAFQRD